MSKRATHYVIPRHQRVCLFGTSRMGKVLVNEEGGMEPGWVEVEWDDGSWTTEKADDLGVEKGFSL